MDLSFSSDWEEYYYQRVKDMYCSSCKLKFGIDVMFMMKCGYYLAQYVPHLCSNKRKKSHLNALNVLKLLETMKSL